MKTIIALIAAFVCLSNIAQANYIGSQGLFINEIKEQREQEYQGEDSVQKFLQNLERLVQDIKTINDAIPKGSRSPIKEIDQLMQIETADMCVTCENTVYATRNASDKEAYKNMIEKFAIGICEKNIGMNASICEGAIARYGEVVWPALLDRTFDASRLCQKLHFCPDTTHKQVLKDYIDEVMADKPPKNYPTPTKKSTYTVLHFSDPHIDLDYQEGSNSVCTEPLCCRASNGVPNNQSEAAGYWGTVGYCDIPMRTFDQFLQYTSKNFEIDMILWTGDNIAHNIWEQSAENQTVNTYDATQHLLQYFPTTPVYPMFGNHEPFPCDEFDFLGNNSAWLTEKLADMWKPWLDDEADSTLREHSYYAIVDPKRNVKIIALDTVACDSNNFYLFENPTDPQNQLAWLRSELYASESTGQGVFIIGHIPPGSWGCDSEWSGRYNALVDRFTNIIRGQFFGHTHDDEISITRSYADNTPVGVVYIAPSLTTYSNLKPSFRIFEIDSETHVPINYYQYRLDIEKWNKNTNGPIEWDLAYDVLSEYNLADMSFVTFDNLVEQIKENKEVTELYLYNMYSGTSTASPLDPRDLQHLYCGVKYSVSKDAFQCLGLNATKGDIIDMAQQMLPGAWTFSTF